MTLKPAYCIDDVTCEPIVIHVRCVGESANSEFVLVVVEMIAFVRHRATA
jgi:hypothetical protein